MATGGRAEEEHALSWRVVSMIYAVGSGLCVLLAVLHYAFAVKQVEGFWLIFAFFPPCLLYSLHRMRLQLQAQARTAKAAKSD